MDRPVRKGEQMILYVYKVVREDINGNRGKRARQLYRYKPDLKIGGLYVHLGSGFPGMQRVLSMETEEYPDPPEEGEEWNENNG